MSFQSFHTARVHRREEWRMPMKPKKPCRHPGCPKLTDGLYCEEHEALHRGDRASSSKRGYNRQWQKARVRYLKAHPLCVQCLKEGHAVTATVVDHIRPHRGDPVLFWDEKNWQSLCKPCHDKKTWNEDNNPEYRFWRQTVGVSESLQAEPLKTDGPLCVNFRRIKQGGYPQKSVYVKISAEYSLKPILFCRIVPKSAGKMCKKQHKKHSFSAYILAEI